MSQSPQYYQFGFDYAIGQPCVCIVCMYLGIELRPHPIVITLNVAESSISARLLDLLLTFS